MVSAVLSVAFAQPMTAVPAGSAAVTVFLCPRADGCAEEWRALGKHMREVALPLLDFDTIALAGVGGRDALDRYEAAMAPIRRGEPGEALPALMDLPYTVTADDLFLLQLQEGARLFPSPASDRALAAAASVSQRRVTDLPPLPVAVLARYLDLATTPIPEPGRIVVVPDVASARVYVDGAPFDGGEMSAGWHRVSVERPGRLTAWTGTLDVAPGRTSEVAASVASDDGPIALEAAVIAARHGSPAPEVVTRALQDWARNSGLGWVRFVELVEAGAEIPEERLRNEDPQKPDWDVLTVYLDVGTGRLTPHGPGPAALLVAADPNRFRLGLSLGYLRLEDLADTDGIPIHDHVTIELAAQMRLARHLGLDVRMGLAHSAQLYYLDVDWRDRNVYPVSVGFRLDRGGPYVEASALAVVPYAIGAEARFGWDFAPSAAFSVAPELRAGFTDRGWLAGTSLVVVRRR